MAEDWFHIPLQLTFGSNPFHELHHMEQAMEELMDQSFPPPRYQLIYPGPTPLRLTRKAVKPSEKIQIATLNVQHYKPEEITVKCEGGKLLVRGEHYSEGQQGFEKGSFERKYDIPEDVDPKAITYQILSNGILLIEAPNPKADPPQVLQVVKPEGVFDGELVEDETKFGVTIKVPDFKPEDITITVKGNELMVTGKQETEDKGYYHSSQFVRQFVLPSNVDMSTLKSTYSQGGLCIEANKTDVPAIESRQLTIENTDE